MHKEARNFCFFVRHFFPTFFWGKRVLDVGSGDINGNNRFLFDRCSYEGNDVSPAPNVSIVSKTKDLPFEDETFDTVVSTECFEHDPEYAQSFQKIYKLLKPGGLFFFTCASTGRPEHGTRNSKPNQSYGTIASLEDMCDYYKNLTIEDIQQLQDLKDVFSVYRSFYNSYSRDLYFVGIKHGGIKEYDIPLYSEDDHIVETTLV